MLSDPDARGQDVARGGEDAKGLDAGRGEATTGILLSGRHVTEELLPLPDKADPPLLVASIRRAATLANRGGAQLKTAQRLRTRSARLE